MDHATVLALYDRTMRRGAVPDGPGARVERDARRPADRAGARVERRAVVRPDGRHRDGAIAAQIRHYTDLGLAFEWKLHDHDAPHDLAERLQGGRFRPEPEEALMVAESAALATRPCFPTGSRSSP